MAKFLHGYMPENVEDRLQVEIDAIQKRMDNVKASTKLSDKRKQEKIEYEKTKQKEVDLIGKELEDYVGVDKTYNHININTATVGELIQLPHIGPATAKKIVDYRNIEPFEHIKQITDVAGIGRHTFIDIKPYITVWGLLWQI